MDVRFVSEIEAGPRIRSELAPLDARLAHEVELSTQRERDLEKRLEDAVTAQTAALQALHGEVAATRAAVDHLAALIVTLPARPAREIQR
jgi:hypothetical protein